MFRKMMTRTLHWLLWHKSTRRMIESAFTDLLENEKTRKEFESVLLKTIIRYGEMKKL